MVVKLVERSFQRHRVCSILSSYERVMPLKVGAVGREPVRKFKGILVFSQIISFERKLGFLRVKKRRRREEEEKKRRKRRSTSFRRGISSGVIPIKDLAAFFSGIHFFQLAYSYIPCTDASWPASFDDADSGDCLVANGLSERRTNGVVEVGL
uniref:Late blight resistance protein, putative n=1 Tax=Solanum demissum TaxID=50514 RepID=Q6L3Y4_SOLDE|nr:late blight resistance protein, putative [Solanum demissum]